MTSTLESVAGQSPLPRTTESVGHPGLHSLPPTNLPSRKGMDEHLNGLRAQARIQTLASGFVVKLANTEALNV